MTTKRTRTNLKVILSFIIGFAISLVIWSITGYLAGKLLRGKDYGLIGNIVMGMIGGVVGSLFMGILGWTGIFSIPFGGIIAGVIGAVVVVMIVRTFFDDQFAT